jgi:hypothetical protein
MVIGGHGELFSKTIHHVPDFQFTISSIFHPILASCPPLFWWRAAQLFRAADFRQAADLLAQLVAFGQTGHYERTFGFDPSIIRENAIANLGACFTHLGQLDRAEQCFRQLLDSPTHHAQAVQNLAVVEKRRRQAQSPGKEM